MERATKRVMTAPGWGAGVAPGVEGTLFVPSDTTTFSNRGELDAVGLDGGALRFRTDATCTTAAADSAPDFRPAIPWGSEAAPGAGGSVIRKNTQPTA